MQIKIEDYPGSLDAARHLIAARESGVAGPRLPGRVPPAIAGPGLRRAAAHRATAASKSARTASPPGRTRCHRPTRPWSPHLRVHRCLRRSRAHRGPHRHCAHRAGNRIRDCARPAHRAEPYTEAEIDAAIGGARLALEILAAATPPRNTSACPNSWPTTCSTWAWCSGPQIASPRIPPRQHEHHAVGGRRGSEQHAGIHPNDRPKAGLYWLANFPRQQGLGLRAGQHVITGSYAGFLDVPANRDVSLAYGDLGVLRLRFSR